MSAASRRSAPACGPGCRSTESNVAVVVPGFHTITDRADRQRRGRERPGGREHGLPVRTRKHLPADPDLDHADRVGQHHEPRRDLVPSPLDDLRAPPPGGARFCGAGEREIGARARRGCGRLDQGGTWHVKGTHLVATLVALALALALASCGGDDGQDGRRLPRPAPARRHRRIPERALDRVRSLGVAAMWRRAAAAPVSRTPSGRPLPSGRLNRATARPTLRRTVQPEAATSRSRNRKPKTPAEGAGRRCRPASGVLFTRTSTSRGKTLCYAYGSEGDGEELQPDRAPIRRRSRGNTRAFTRPRRRR